jgi:hypothetical protein
VRALGQRRSAARLPVRRAACTGGFSAGRCGAERFAGKSAPAKKSKAENGRIEKRRKRNFPRSQLPKRRRRVNIRPVDLSIDVGNTLKTFFSVQFFSFVFCESLVSSFEMCADWNGSDHHGHHHHVHHHRSMSGNAAMLHAMR